MANRLFISLFQETWIFKAICLSFIITAYLTGSRHRAYLNLMAKPEAVLLV